MSPVPIRPAFRPLLPKPPDSRSAPVCELSISKKPLTKRSHHKNRDGHGSCSSSASVSTSGSSKKKRISSEPPTSTFTKTQQEGLPSTISPASLMAPKAGRKHSTTGKGSSKQNQPQQKPINKPTLSTTYTTPTSTAGTVGGAFRRNTSLLLSMGSSDTLSDLSSDPNLVDPLNLTQPSTVDAADFTSDLMTPPWDAVEDLWATSSPELGLDSEETASIANTNDDLFSLDSYVTPDETESMDNASLVSSFLDTGIII